MSLLSITGDTPLRAVVEWLQARVHEGIRCPACGQNAEVYPRTMYGATGRGLIDMWKKGGTDWVHVPTVTNQKGGDLLKARHWGLIEGQPGTREDGSQRNGYWRLTPLGVDFIHDRARVPRTAMVYANGCLELVGPKMVGIRDIIGREFRYDELMERME